MHRGKQTRKTLKQTPKKHLELGVEELAGVNYQDLELGQKEKCCKNLPSWVFNVPMERLSQLRRPARGAGLCSGFRRALVWSLSH